jgi:hypothetical protein
MYGKNEARGMSNHAELVLCMIFVEYFQSHLSGFEVSVIYVS